MRINAARLLLAAIMAMASGCILGNRPTFVPGGADTTEITYYLDGAGNYGFGKETVPLGLMDAGYNGQVEHFIWTSYLGPLTDQIAYPVNRMRAQQLANRIRDYIDQHPRGTVNIIGLSAGSGIATFALERLPMKYRVDNVIMLSSSLSARYDLSRALRRVRGGVYFFWSPNDPILGSLVPIVGTVDGEHTSQVAGVVGAKLPPAVSYDERELYTKVHNVRWYANEIGGRLKLQHAGTTDRTFVRDMVAPIIVRSKSRHEAHASQRSTTRPAVASRPSSRPAVRIP
jgi:pimeloyl-ACP methyl ester carboxylesterase